MRLPALIRCRMFVKSSITILAAPTLMASLTIALLVSWLMCFTRRASLPETCRSFCFALGLKTTAQGKVTLAAKDLARAHGGKDVFSDIHAYHDAGCHRLLLVDLNSEVEEPPSFAQDQFRFFGLSRPENAALMFAEAQRYRDASIEGVERYASAFDGVGALNGRRRGRSGFQGLARPF